MSETTVGFVGGGRVARIVLGGWTRSGRSLAGVVVSDSDAEVLQSLKASYPSITATPDNKVAAAQPVVFVALHPPAFPAALDEVKASLKPDGVLVSLAPKWTMSRICDGLGGFRRVARVIPNAPSIINKGYNPVSFSSDLPPRTRTAILTLLAPLGACPEVAEDTLEAYAIVAAMGPTYLWYQLYQLIDLGCEFGLTRESATEAVASMVHGAASAMLEAGLPPEGVMDLIPVKPLSSIEQTVREAYVGTLGALHKKLTG